MLLAATLGAHQVVAPGDRAAVVPLPVSRRRPLLAYAPYVVATMIVRHAGRLEMASRDTALLVARVRTAHVVGARTAQDLLGPRIRVRTRCGTRG